MSFENWFNINAVSVRIGSKGTSKSTKGLIDKDFEDFLVNELKEEEVLKLMAVNLMEQLVTDVNWYLERILPAFIGGNCITFEQHI
ncbi:MAG: hypothetical protein GX383_11175 [Clostridium sp.]|nr:hypothetical protein [Clostridium sp.]